MGQLLTRVVSTNDKGLIGITKEGEEVPLNSPEIKLLKREISKSMIDISSVDERKDYLDCQHNLEVQEIILRTTCDKYIRFSKDWALCTDWIVQPYNVYTRRD